MQTARCFTASVALGVLLLANLLSVEVFGELEFWFASTTSYSLVAEIKALWSRPRR